jgi:hypothetical protein
LDEYLSDYPKKHLEGVEDPLLIEGEIPSFYLLYFNRSRSDALHRGFSGLARGQVKSRARKGALENLVNVQRSIEAQFAAGAA